MRDAIPDPNIINAALRACRHQNDFALAIRFLETVQVNALHCPEQRNLCFPWLQ